MPSALLVEECEMKICDTGNAPLGCFFVCRSPYRPRPLMSRGERC